MMGWRNLYGSSAQGKIERSAVAGYTAVSLCLQFSGTVETCGRASSFEVSISKSIQQVFPDWRVSASSPADPVMLATS